MIKACAKCGGLYTTESLETFAGTPCRCLAPLTTAGAQEWQWQTQQPTTPPDFTEQVGAAASWEDEARRLLTACCYVINGLADQQAMPDNSHGQLLKSIGGFLQQPRTLPQPSLTEQARQLVSKCRVYSFTRCPIGYIYDDEKLEQAVVSALAEAATAALEQERKRVRKILEGSIPANDEKVYALLAQVIAAIGDDKEQQQ